MAKDKEELDEEIVQNLHQQLLEINQGVARLDERMEHTENRIRVIEQDIDSLEQQTTKNTHKIGIGVIVTSMAVTWLLNNLMVNFSI